MNRSLFKRVFPQVMAFVVAFALSGVLAAARDAAPAGQRTDGQIEMDVVHALDASQALKNDLITAATIQAEVTLSGTVSSDASRNLAESIVKGVPGVTGVHNNLKVGNPANDPNAQGAVDDSANQDNADDNQQQAPARPPTMAPAPDGSQNQAPAYGQNAPPPDYGQNQPQNPQPGYGQNPPPGYGQNPPPGYGQNPPPGYGQNQPPPAYGQNPYPPQYRDQYPPAGPPQPSYDVANGPLTIPSGTLIQLRTSEPVSSKRATEGTPVQFTVIRDV